MSKQKETGKGGLTSQIKKLLDEIQAYVPMFYYVRNQVATIRRERIISKTPENEKGRPDFEIIWNGQFYGWELKTDKGELSEFQEKQKERIEAAGGIYEIIRSYDDAIHKINSYGIFFKRTG